MVQISMGRTISILFTNEKIKEYDEIFIILAVPVSYTHLTLPTNSRV
mgnify:CR=1 FL=1